MNAQGFGLLVTACVFALLGWWCRRPVRVCTHPRMGLHAATGIEPTEPPKPFDEHGPRGSNGIVGVTALCPDCGWTFSRDITAGLPAEWAATPCRVNGMDYEALSQARERSHGGAS